MADENAPATKKDLWELSEQTKKDMQAVEELLKKDLRETEDRLKKPQSVQMRMDVMERRLGEIEKKLLLNPPAA